MDASEYLFIYYNREIFKQIMSLGIYTSIEKCYHKLIKSMLKPLQESLNVTEYEGTNIKM